MPKFYVGDRVDYEGRAAHVVQADRIRLRNCVWDYLIHMDDSDEQIPVDGSEIEHIQDAEAKEDPFDKLSHELERLNGLGVKALPIEGFFQLMQEVRHG